MTTSFKQVQAQPFALAGGGAISGATSIILQSFAQINGTLLTMTDFGLKGFGTLEPGNGTLEEQIVFTGVTQNSNGTATLTGVSTVLMISPYTASSGLAQTHAGSTTFVLSNTSGYYDQFVAKDDDATITGKYTFPNGANTPVLGASYVAPTSDTQVASKKYVDDVSIVGGTNATTTTQGLVQLPLQAQVDAKTLIGSTGAALAITPDLVRSTLLSDYIVATGTANALVLTPSPAIVAYQAGQRFSFKVANTNSATAVISVSGLSSTAILKSDGATGLSPSDLITGQVVEIELGTNGFQLMSPAANTVPTGSIHMYAGSSAPTGWLLCDGTSYTRATYLGLFNVIGSTFGSADGSHFNVPDMRGRAPVGVGTGAGGGASGTGVVTGGSALTARALSAWTGEETHVLTTTEMPSHTHTVPVGAGGGNDNTRASYLSSATGPLTTPSGSAGSDGAHNTMQPILTVNFIIKT